MSKEDEFRSMERELACLKDKTLKANARAELLADIEAERERLRGTYHTNVETMTCSCPSYLISRWLLCKHLVREVNRRTGNLPLNNLPFFHALRRNHFAPFYSIPEIHFKTEQEENFAASPELEFEQEDSQVQAASSPAHIHERSSPFCSDEDKLPLIELTKEVINPLVGNLLGDDEGESSKRVSIYHVFSCLTRHMPDGIYQMFFSSEYVEHTEENIQNMLGIIKQSQGVHPKLGKILKRAFDERNKTGKDITKEKRRRTTPRTWKDSNSVTLFMD
ncbi:hypothetical protein D9757_015171 [Collybiopsis confluens]|uniref:SWIM-type domain-containing protein n=1 Tax=Collybiopsis confluens TaxID=2823264 RepID=A0A8H5GAA2_9AGAR|nr:hypothetical protein D9757_015171 [Collybiopsis confluens]